MIFLNYYEIEFHSPLINTSVSECKSYLSNTSCSQSKYWHLYRSITNSR